MKRPLSYCNQEPAFEDEFKALPIASLDPIIEERLCKENETSPFHVQTDSFVDEEGRIQVI